MRQENLDLMKIELMGGLKKYVDDQMKEFLIKSNGMGQVKHEGAKCKMQMHNEALDSMKAELIGGMKEFLKSELSQQLKHHNGVHDEAWDSQQEPKGLGGSPHPTANKTRPPKSKSTGDIWSVIFVAVFLAFCFGVVFEVLCGNQK